MKGVEVVVLLLEEITLHLHTQSAKNHLGLK